MELRRRLEALDRDLLATFIQLTADARPFLETVETLFPDFTRHDPSHVVKLEQIAHDLLTPQALDLLTAADLFVLLSALWLHDAGMAVNPTIEIAVKSQAQYQHFRNRGLRLGLDELNCYRLYIRDHHHEFCPHIATTLLAGKVPGPLVHWIGQIGKSHGESRVHDRREWPKTVAVGDGTHIQSPFLAAVVRLADILHFNSARAPEYMLEHRHISGESLRHWRAHQVSADYTIADDICFFDGVTSDDEAYWFAQQFVEAMDREALYCIERVFPTLDPQFVRPLRFSRVQSRLVADGFISGSEPVRLRVDPAKFLGDLLRDNLYAGKPTWFRETLQNAFDAARDRIGLEPGAKPHVIVEADTLTGLIEFRDTGVGMTATTVKDFLLVAGASYWKSSEYLAGRAKPAAHVGRFGIGFLSLLGVADQIEVETRHIGDETGWRYCIRNAERAVRVERISRPEAGTTIRIRMKPMLLAQTDFVALFDQTCTFPEFPTTLIVDRRVERALAGPLYPDIATSGIDLSQDQTPRCAARLVRENLHGPGFRGDCYIPKVKLSSLAAFVPTIRGWERTAGWLIKGSSTTVFGGINYPAFHSVGGLSGYLHVPSIGILRLVVEPESYALEMNLARDQFVAGEATNRLLQNVCKAFDHVFVSDLRAELDGRDPLTRSAIAARHSYALLHLWLGYVPSLSRIQQGCLPSPSPVAPSPWVRMSTTMAENLLFACLDLTGRVEQLPIQEIVARGLTVFALGSSPRGIDGVIVDTLRRCYPGSYLLAGIPDYDFGVLELRQWAVEQVLVPVESYSRSLFGVRLGNSAHPYAFFPGPLDHVGIPTASGPPEFAVADYRDSMAEARGRPLGSQGAVGVLNERHDGMANLIRVLSGSLTAGIPAPRVHEATKALRQSLDLGLAPKYDRSSRASIVRSLNEVAASVGCDVSFKETDLPSYFDGGESRPFGTFGLSRTAADAIQETETLEQPIWHLT